MKSLVTVLLATVITGTSSFFLKEAAAQGTTTFVCGTSTVDGKVVPTTIAKTRRGDVPVIRWVSTWSTGSGFTPQKRCEIVSKSFQTYHEAGQLNYLTTGRVNGQAVICPAITQGGV